MSTNSRFLMVVTEARGISVDIPGWLAKITGLRGVKDTPKRAARTDATMSVSVAQDRSNWVDSIVGAFDNSPVYARIIENAKENRRLMEEQINLE